MQRQEQVEKQLADFLATSPKLAKHLARWQAQDAKI
jgi:anti-sigma factor RsiW